MERNPSEILEYRYPVLDTFRQPALTAPHHTVAPNYQNQTANYSRDPFDRYCSLALYKRVCLWYHSTILLSLPRHGSPQASLDIPAVHCAGSGHRGEFLAFSTFTILTVHLCR
jgi:hypothetical protein